MKTEMEWLGRHYQDTIREKAERERQARQDEFEAWVCKAVITQTVFDQLSEADRDCTFENAKVVWLDVLENLTNMVREAIRYKLPITD